MPARVRKLGFAWIAEELPVGAKDDRQLTHVHMEAIDERLGLRIGLRIKPLAWMPIALEKALKPQHVAIIGTADNDRAAGSGLKQADTAQDQRAHNPFAEIGLRDQ